MAAAIRLRQPRVKARGACAIAALSRRLQMVEQANEDILLGKVSFATMNLGGAVFTGIDARVPVDIDVARNMLQEYARLLRAELAALGAAQ